MLRLSKLADYSTVIMVYMAQNPEVLCNTKELAIKTHLQRPTVSKLLKLLSNSGLLTSVRGTKGGYRLAKPADKISVTEIIDAVEGHRGLTECSYLKGECFLETVCHIKHNWNLINHAVATALSTISLAHLSQPKLEEVHFNMNITKITPSITIEKKTMKDGV